ncbi:MAG TPA: hypothetical protein VJ813_13910 [Vicinamibacterales bacterium]|nr:hypothetical protein [Vicinamibacterales bacterium]
MAIAVDVVSEALQQWQAAPFLPSVDEQDTALARVQYETVVDEAIEAVFEAMPPRYWPGSYGRPGTMDFVKADPLTSPTVPPNRLRKRVSPPVPVRRLEPKANLTETK